jgi:uroporphyrin-3 C-methyltransferase
LLIAWLWYDSQADVSGLRENVALRAAEIEQRARAAEAYAREAQQTSREVAAKLSLLEARIADSQNQQVALEALYRELAAGRDEALSSEVERLANIAAQQLQLAGNVQAALTALQNADARLAQAKKPQFIPLRKALGRDIERLRNAPQIDVTGLSLRLAELAERASTLPVMTEAGVPPPAALTRGKSAATDSTWRRALNEFWGEMKQVVRVTRFDQPGPVLTSPEQSFFLRENLRLRLLDARVALLQREHKVFLSDISSARGWVAEYFDTSRTETRNMSAALAQIESAGIPAELPNLTETLTAVQVFHTDRRAFDR